MSQATEITSLGWRRSFLGWRRRAANGVLDVRAAVRMRTAGLRSRMQPLLEVATPAARVLVVLAVMSLVGSFTLGWTELIVAAVFLATLLTLSCLFILGRHQLDAELGLGRDRVVVGERANGRIVLTNKGARRALPLTVELPVGAGSAGFDLPGLASGEEHEDLFAVPTVRRSVLKVGPVTAVRTDPLGLLRREQHLTGVHDLFVHPRTVRIDSSQAGLVRDLEGQAVGILTDSDISFHALRDYVPGDDRRHIHWKSTARTGNLMVRQFEETRRSHLLVAVSTRLDDYSAAEEFELAISAAGSLAVQALRDGHTVTAATSVRRLRAVTPGGLLDQLSAVEFERQAPRMTEVARRLGREVPGASVAILICGATVAGAEMRKARRELGIDTRTIVIRSEAIQESTVKPLGDLQVARLGVLDQLPALMRRLMR
jgi:uncharacterized protein (DUF58 family)